MIWRTDSAYFKPQYSPMFSWTENMQSNKYNIGTNAHVIRGITLMEFLITLVIVAILASISIPSFHQLLQWVRISVASSDLERTIRNGRRQAITSGQTVRICPSVDGTSCSRDNMWQNGWITFIDSTGSMRREPEDKMLAVHDKVKAIKISHNRGTLLSFNRLGRLSQNGSFTICNTSGDWGSRKLVMIHSSRLRLESVSSECNAAM